MTANTSLLSQKQYKLMQGCTFLMLQKKHSNVIILVDQGHPDIVDTLLTGADHFYPFRDRSKSSVTITSHQNFLSQRVVMLGRKPVREPVRET